MTEVRDAQGNQLWNPADFGRYSMEKIEAISKIIATCLANTTLNISNAPPSGEGGAGDTSGFYTKSQSDERYLIASNATKMIEELVKQYASTYIQDETVTPDELSEVRNWLVRLYNQVNGINIDDPREPSGDYLVLQVDNLSDRERTLANTVLGIQRDVYLLNNDNTISSQVRFAYNSFVGIETKPGGRNIENLSTDFTDRTNLVSAVNELMSKLKSVEGSMPDLSALDSFYDDKTSLVAVLNKLATEISSLKSEVSSLSDKVAALEGSGS